MDFVVIDFEKSALLLPDNRMGKLSKKLNDFK